MTRQVFTRAVAMFRGAKQSFDCLWNPKNSTTQRATTCAPTRAQVHNNPGFDSDHGAIRDRHLQTGLPFRFCLMDRERAWGPARHGVCHSQSVRIGALR